MPFVRKHYTADFHFAHLAIIHSANRPFSSAEEMDAFLIDRIKHSDVWVDSTH